MRKYVNFIWGIALILVGGLFLLENLGFIAAFSPTVWAVLFAGASLLFFVAYFFNGVREWPWLIPATLLASVALVIWLAARGTADPFLGTIVLWGLSLPFWVAFVADRRANWWALIPGWITAVLGLIVLVADRLPGEVVGSLVLLSIALPFLVVYLSNRTFWWALIPAGVLGGIGVILLFVNQSSEVFIGTFVTLAIALPFYFVYFRFKEHWWALIPAGVMTTVAVVVLLANWADAFAWGGRLVTAVLFFGFAVPFALLWRQRSQNAADWAKYPAVGLVIAGLLSAALGARVELIWPLVLIIVGGWLLYETTRRPKLKG